METVLYVVHIFVCLALIPIILLQSGKGGGVSAAFGGGGSSTMFGSRGASNFLTKMTTAAAIIFMLTSLSLSWYSSKSASVVGDISTEQSAPASTGGSAEDKAASSTTN